MPQITDLPPAYVQEELKALRAALDETIPARQMDRNLIIATWNIRAFGDLTRKWAAEDTDTPKRDLHSVLCIAEILSRFDVIAIQEVKSNLRALRDMLKVLGPHWGFVMTDVTRGSAGNDERMAFLFDTRRVQMSGLACELVVPREWLREIGQDALQEQFARTPYVVSFRSGRSTFILVTLHVLFGRRAQERIPELRAIARWMADWAKSTHTYHQNFIVLGDFNIDARGDLLSQTFFSQGLYVPPDMENTTRSIFNETKYYDHIAWFNGDNGVPRLSMEYVQGGNFDFVGKTLVDLNLTKNQLSWRLSDHYPLWAEFAAE
jgi:endonuclease/exonuclease/phosphatase family metal-dependent hydrolase